MKEDDRGLQLHGVQQCAEYLAMWLLLRAKICYTRVVEDEGGKMPVGRESKQHHK